MAFASFVVGALGGAFATHTLSLELDEFSAATNLANYKGAGASSQVSSPPFSLEVRLSRIFWIHGGVNVSMLLDSVLTTVMRLPPVSATSGRRLANTLPSPL
jgi:hypothetical protein